jgi:hypothetical protein
MLAVMAIEQAPLTAAETEIIQGMLRARTHLAQRFSTLAAAPALLFGLLQAQALGHPGGLPMTAASLALFALVGWIVWHFGWRLVRDMREDLAGGQKQIITGTIDSIDAQKNAHGETITHLTIGGVKLVSRAPAMGGWQPGQLARIEYLRRSKVIFRGQLAEPAG